MCVLSFCVITENRKTKIGVEPFGTIEPVTPVRKRGEGILRDTVRKEREPGGREPSLR